VLSASILISGHGAKFQQTFGQPTMSEMGNLRDLLLFVETAVVIVLLIEIIRLQRIRKRLKRQIPMEQFISELSTRLSESPVDQVGMEIQSGLKKLVEMEGFDHLCWFAIHDDSSSLRKIYSAKTSGKTMPAPPSLDCSDMPWSVDRLLKGQAVSIRQLNDLPPEAEADRHFIEKYGVKSIALVPCGSGSQAKGVLVPVCFSQRRNWPAPLLAQLKVIGNIFANALLRRNAEQAEQKSELLFQRFFQGAGVGMAVVDPEGYAVVTNPALCAMLGYTHEELTKMSFFEITDPVDLAQNRKLFHELLNGQRTTYQLEKRYLCKDGTTRWGLMTASTLYRQPDEPVFLIGMIEDITQRKTAETKLLTSQTLVRSTLDSLSAQVAILDETANIIAVNARWKEIATKNGIMSESANVGDNYFDICKSTTGVDFETANRAAEAVHLTLNGGTPVGPIVYSCKGATETYWYQIRMTRFEDEGVPRIVLSYEDITEVMTVRKLLYEKQEWLNLALEASRTKIWDWNIVTDQVRWSEDELTALENTPAGLEIKGNSQQLFTYIHPKDRETVVALFRNLIDGPENEFSTQFRILGSTETVRWTLAKGRILRDSMGKAMRFLCVNTDITELKLAQIELRRLTARLIQAQEEERQRIARELHDDIGQRLSLLIIGLESLSQDSRIIAQEEISSLKQIADELSTDIHQLSHRLHSSKLQHLGLKVALQDLCRQMTSRDTFKVNFLATTIDPVPAEVALCLYRIAQESLLNARKYSNANNVILAVARNDGTLCMQIKDSGVGFDLNIPSEGLGFINMRERLRTIGGELFIDSKLGEGTNVTAIVHVDSVSREAKAS